MRLERLRVVRLGPFDELELDFRGEDDEPRGFTVLHGESGTGKTTLLSSIAATRPGNHVVQTHLHRRGGGSSHAVCDWKLGEEDPERPHALRVSTPGIKLESDDRVEQLRRKEQLHFDRLAADGGFGFLALPGTRRFPAVPLNLGDPSRGLLRHDPRGGPSFHDSSRCDLSRACKQVLAYASISASLAANVKGEASGDPRVFGSVVSYAVDRLLQPLGYEYRGLSPRTFDSRFESAGGTLLGFDGLPIAARHLVAMAVLPVHALWVAGKGADPREAEGAIVIDDADLHLPGSVQQDLPTALREVLPNAQWILGTGSPTLAAAVGVGELVALRRQPGSDRIEVFVDELGVTH